MTDTNKTSGADVLAILDRCAEIMHDDAAPAMQDADIAADLRSGAVDLIAARTAVASLIERNAELEAERNMLGQAIADAAHKAGITHADALIDGPTLLLLCEDLANCAAMPDAIIEERDALAAEVKALREKLADLADAADEEMECGFNVPATPSRRILRAAIDAARASAATDGGGNE